MRLNEDCSALLDNCVIVRIAFLNSISFPSCIFSFPSSLHPLLKQDSGSVLIPSGEVRGLARGLQCQPNIWVQRVSMQVFLHSHMRKGDASGLEEEGEEMCGS